MALVSAAVEKIVEFPTKRAMRPIDLVHLAKQCLGDEHLEYEILRLFDTSMQTYFNRLVLSMDTSELAMNLHSIKGAASGVGAWTIVDLARAAEAEIRDGRDVSPELVADLGLAVEEVHIFVERMLSSEPA